jgi:hypothetical protein
MFTLEFLDSAGVMDIFVVAQIVFIGKFTFACRTLVWSLFDGKVYGEVDVKDSFADGGVGAEVTPIGLSTQLGHLLFVVTGLLHISWLWGAVDTTGMPSEIALSVEAPETVRTRVYGTGVVCWMAGTKVGDKLEVGCESCTTTGADVDMGDVGWHKLGAEVTSGLVIELVDFVEMTSKGSAVGKPFDAQRALVDVWEMCLRVEGPLEGVVRPIGAVGTGVAAAES